MTAYHSALLVGGSSAIGRAIVEALLLPLPGRIVLAGRSSAALDEAVRALRARAHRVRSVPYDAGWATEQCNAMLDSVWADDGDFDLVVLAVGALGAGNSGEHRAAGHKRHHAVVPGQLLRSPAVEPDLEHVLQANLVGPALVANRTAEHLARQGRGALVVVTSAAAVRPRQEVLAYAAAKQSLDTLAKGLDSRLRPHGARCLVVRPGRVATRMTAGLDPVPLTTGPEQVAARVRAALSTDTTVVWSPRGMGLLTHALRLAPQALLPAPLR